MGKKMYFTSAAVPGDECLKDNSTLPGVNKVDLNDNPFMRYLMYIIVQYNNANPAWKYVY